MTTDQCAQVIRYAVLDMIKQGWLVVGPELAKIDRENGPDDFGTPASASHFKARCKMYAELPYGFDDTETVHACPVGDSGITPCCGKTPFALPRTDRLTVHPELVTCKRQGGAE